MKAMASLTFGITSAVALCFGGMCLAPYVLAEPEHASFKDAPDLWSIQPRQVDIANQRYQRLPPLLSTYASAELQRRTTQTREPVVAAPSQTAAALTDKTLASSHSTWCSAKYRSYNRSTNSYRAFDGRLRRCSSPSTETVHAADTAKTGEQAWCASRYDSYRPDDNTYQPYDGPRTACIAPVATAAVGEQLTSIN